MIRFSLISFHPIKNVGLGILLAFLMYKPNPIISPQSVGNTFKPVYILFHRKYFIDEFYEGVVVKRLYYNGIALLSDWFDRNIVDRTVNVLGWLGANFGSLIRQLQTGQMQMYATATSIGIIVIAAIFIFGK